MPLSPRLSASDAELRAKFSNLSTDADVADLLEVPIRQLRYILYNAPSEYPYHVFTVPKRTGGDRTIEAPHDTIRILQRKLLRVLTLVQEPRQTAHGFMIGRDIVTNATPHVGKALVLNVDLKDFFPSINFGRVRGAFMATPYGVGPAAATVLAQLACHQRRLPQGAPTSPIISNLVCFRLDGQLKALARDYKWFYTRYADDLTFSSWSTSLPAPLAIRAGLGSGDVVVGPRLSDVITSNGFEVNTLKVRLQGRPERQGVTGLVVNQRVNVPRKFIRDTQALIHWVDQGGLTAAQERLEVVYTAQKRRKIPPVEAAIRGRLNFIRRVRGAEDAAYLQLIAHAVECGIAGIPPQHRAAVLPKATRPRPNLGSWYREYETSVVEIRVQKSDNTTDYGTAWLMASGRLATAAHCVFEKIDGVLQPMRSVAIVWPNGDESNVLPDDLASHPGYLANDIDVAVMRVDTKRARLGRVIPLQLSEPLPNTALAALGFPGALREQPKLALTSGILQAVFEDGRGTKRLAIDAALHNGMSGGPVFDGTGGAIGIISGTIERGGLSLYRAIPVQYLEALKHI